MTSESSDDDLNFAVAALSKSEDDLLLDFGMLLAGPGERRDGDHDDFRSRAQNWLHRNHADLRRLICGNVDVKKLSSTAVDLAALADLVAAVVSKPAAFTVAAILLKRGLENLCE